jgi:hypothetical protein
MDYDDSRGWKRDIQWWVGTEKEGVRVEIASEPRLYLPLPLPLPYTTHFPSAHRTLGLQQLSRRISRQRNEAMVL